MHQTPQSNRTHIGIFGKRNAGKSSLLNAISEQNIALVSEIGGTTTDPVKKAMELIPYGPVLFIDTAGLDDKGTLGSLRTKRSKEMFAHIDFAIVLHSSKDIDLEFEKELLKDLKTFNVPFIKVINKTDLVDNKTLLNFKNDFSSYQLISTLNRNSILDFKKELIKELSKKEEEETLLGDMLPYNSDVVLVIPIDSEAPKGRLILPQVQLIRDCLDHGIKCHVVRDTELEDAINYLPKIDLVVTDSQAFKEVSKIVPNNINLTSFSILLARQKGDLGVFKDGINALDSLKEDAHILIAETCTHNTSHEDIGRYKIPALLKRHFGNKLDFTFFQGKEYPSDLANYDLVIHCGGCMLTRKQMLNRMTLVENKQIPITNYGMFLAWGANILERSLLPFKEEL